MESVSPTTYVILNESCQQVNAPHGKRLILRTTSAMPYLIPKSSKESSMYKCNTCSKTFYYKKYLTTHEIRVHGRKKRKDIVEKLSCSLCNKVFTSKISERKHMRNIHGEKKYARKIKCQEEDCSKTFPLMAKLRNHLQIIHNFKGICDKQELTFNTKQEFQQWLSVEEVETKSHFISLRGIRRCKDYTLQVYGCNRSGMYKSRGSGKRQIKHQGSQKIGFFCTAEISVKHFNSHIEVIYFPEHYRHDKSLHHIPLPKEEKQNIAKKLSQGIDKRKILQDLRLSMISDVKRKHLITKKDLDNIEKYFRLKIESQQPAVLNDERSVYAWVEEMRQTEFNPVLFYKRQGEVHPGIHVQDFIIVVMTAFQKTMLAEFNYDRICIVSLDKICDYNFVLIILFAADKYEEGVPIAFCIASSLCHENLYAYFQCVKDAVPELRSSILMSDDIPMFFNAWEEIFETCEEQFLCSWHIDKEWKMHLNTIKKKGRRDEVYKTLKSLMYELDEDTFNEMLETFVLQLNMDEDSKTFYEYFMANYYGRSQMWAYCYRSEAKIDSDMHIATFYKSIKHSYVDRLKPKRVDECITKLINLVTDRKFAEFIGNKNKNVTNINIVNLQDEHYKFQSSYLNLKESTDTEWEIMSESGESYHITKKHICDTQCQISSCLSNAYQCVCSDYYISKSPCRHIKFLLQYIDAEANSIFNTIAFTSNSSEFGDQKQVLCDFIKSAITKISIKLNNIQSVNNEIISQINIYLTSIKHLLELQRHIPNTVEASDKSFLRDNFELRNFFSVSKETKNNCLINPIDKNESNAETILQQIINF